MLGQNKKKIYRHNQEFLKSIFLKTIKSWVFQGWTDERSSIYTKYTDFQWLLDRFESKTCQYNVKLQW